MSDEVPKQMSIAELLIARTRVRRQLEISPSFVKYGASSFPEGGGRPERATLAILLGEIDTELAERGFKDA